MDRATQERAEMIRILAGEASVEEEQSFYSKLDGDPAKRELFQELSKEWQVASQAMLYKSLDVEKAWERHQKEYLNSDQKPQRHQRNTFWRWVAVLFLGVGIAFYFMDFNQEVNVVSGSFRSGVDEILDVTLPDGSLITLNRDSRLSYHMDDNERNIQLEGEGYFQVEKDASRPFTVEIGNAYVEVLGTTFNLYSGDSVVRVLVSEGLVEFGKKDRLENVRLPVGTYGELSNSRLRSGQLVNLNMISWYTGQLSFNHTPMSQVLMDLEQAYQVDFQFNRKKLENCHLTANFKNEKLNDVLKVITTIFDIQFMEKGDFYQVKSEPCKAS